MTGVHLLDVNVLVALFDPEHVHHELAHDWFSSAAESGWATSPTTESGFLRVLANPAYGLGLRAPEVADLLRRFRSSGRHEFWPERVSLSDAEAFRLGHVQGHRQLTDVYLLGLAVHMNGRLATFDRGIPVAAVAGATRDHLAIIAA